MLELLRPTVGPVGDTEVDNITVPVEPLTLERLMTEFRDSPCFSESSVTIAVIEKSPVEVGGTLDQRFVSVSRA
jgi:hypothetical protein